MAGNNGLPEPHQLAGMGLLNVISMHQFSPDQRLVDEALGMNVPPRQQGGVCDELARVPIGASKPGRS